MKESIRLVKALGGELHITSSYKPSTGLGFPAHLRTRAGPRPGSDFHVERVLDEAAANARIEGVMATTHASKRDPTDALLDVAETADAAMSVVGSKGMRGMERLTLGNVPNRVSHRGLCNVLIAYTGEANGSASH